MSGFKISVGAMMRIVEEALTFDDVLLVPSHSTVMPKDVSLATYVTRDIQLQIPLLSAAMDTKKEGQRPKPSLSGPPPCSAVPRKIPGFALSPNHPPRRLRTHRPGRITGRVQPGDFPGFFQQADVLSRATPWPQKPVANMPLRRTA